jgi:hypothetical protein
VVQPIEDDLVCDLDISRTRTWLHRCEKSNCISMAPKRLVSVDPPGETEVKLIETEGQLVKSVVQGYSGRHRVSL